MTVNWSCIKKCQHYLDCTMNRVFSFGVTTCVASQRFWSTTICMFLLLDNDMQLCESHLAHINIQLAPYDIPVFPLIVYCTDSLLKVPWGNISEIWMRLINERWQLSWSILLFFINHNLCFIHKEKEKCKIAK